MDNATLKSFQLHFEQFLIRNDLTPLQGAMRLCEAQLFAEEAGELLTDQDRIEWLATH